ncbi:MAG: thioredoxin family protein [Phycisphaeraceae bacterium]|nr:thioredoxin family protein [Phycisphaeraceae bacterium]
MLDRFLTLCRSSEPGVLAAGVLTLFAAAPGGAQLFGSVPVDPVRVSVVASDSRVAPGDQLVLAVVLEHAEHWHSWPSAAQDVLPPDIAEFAIRTNVTIAQVPEWVEAVGPVQWPAPSLAKVADPTGEHDTIEVPTYQGKAVAYVPLLVKPGAPAGSDDIVVDVEYQACDETSCMAPQLVEQSASIEIAPVGASGENEKGDPSQFAGFDSSVFAQMAAGSVAAQPATPTGRGASFFGLSLGNLSGVGGFLALAFLGAVGGLILNLTPCVLPVLPIKVMTLSQHAATPGKALALSLWMALGVVAFWVGIGIPVALVGAFSDPSRIFGIWWLTAGIGLVIGVLALGLMGLYTFRLPKAVYMVDPKADSAWGSFLFGVMTAVLGLPCFGFVAGALLPVAATQGPAWTLTVFGSIGVGMALPYLVLALRPGLIDKVPRTGPASELVKQVMGLLLLAAAAYFVGAGARGFISERPALLSGLPWWGRIAHWWVVGLFAGGAGLWLLVRTIQITRKTGRRLVFSAIGLFILGVSVAYAAKETTKARSDVWIAYNAQLFDAARHRGDVVVLDFTAEWCLNCKALKAAVLDRKGVAEQLRSSGVTPLIADVTSTKAPGWAKLRDLGQTGIPTLAVFGPGLESPWISNAYTGEQVLEAIASARGGRQ